MFTHIHTVCRKQKAADKFCYFISFLLHIKTHKITHFCKSTIVEEKNITPSGSY